MERLARRNPKIFFRRAKSYHLMQSLPMVCPLPMTKLMKLMPKTSPFHVRAVDGVWSMIPKRDLPMPSRQKLREASKVPRGKSPGPDGVWTYLFYVLPDECFEYVSEVLHYVWEGGEGVSGLYDAHLLALYKKGDWGETRAWRRISMTHAIYRV